MNKNSNNVYPSMVDANKIKSGTISDNPQDTIMDPDKPGLK